MKVQSVFLAMAMTCTTVIGACGSSSPSPSQTGGNAKSGGSPGGGGTVGTGGTPASTGGGTSCPTATANVAPCGGDVTGTWTVTPSCLGVSGQLDMSTFGIGCLAATVAGGSLDVKGTWSATADGKLTDGTTTMGKVQFSLGPKCLEVSGTTTDCISVSSSLSALGFESVECKSASDGGCACAGVVNQKGGIGLLSADPFASGKITTSGNNLTYPDETKYSYCVDKTKLSLSVQSKTPAITGTIVLQKSAGTATGGATSTGGNTGGVVVTGGTRAGGTAVTGGITSSGGTVGQDAGLDSSPSAGGSAAGGAPPGNRAEGPCDIYAAANTPCAAAYSMVRALSKTYSGPLYQVRSGSSATNAGTGGSVKDIGILADGYADTATQDTFCAGSTCTVSILYDQSGNATDMKRAPKGGAGNGARSDQDCYESSATKGTVTAGGRKVYVLYMNQYEGYRTPLGIKGKSMPLGTSPEGIYMLADGTRFGTACCWDFGNVTTNPLQYHTMNTLFLGQGFWGSGSGSAPWFLADFEGGVWAGGTGASNVKNQNNPPMAGVAFALGILKTSPGKYVIRAADALKAADLTTAWDGGTPKEMDNQGGVVLGVGGDNSNNSWSNFYEGAITVGVPSNDTDLAVMKNIKTVGYSK